MEKTHTAQAEGLQAQAIWKIWEDVNNWHEWDSDTEWARMTQPFENGSRFNLKPKGGPKLSIELSNVERLKTFTDCVNFPFAKMYSVHSLKENDAGVLELSHKVKVTGLLKKLWWHLVAKKVAAGLEEQAKNLIARARLISDKQKLS